MPFNLPAAVIDDVAVFDLDEQAYLFISPTLENILERPLSDLTDKIISWDDLIVDFDDGSATSLDIVSNPTKRSKYRIITPFGKIKWLSEKKMSYRADNGHLIQLRIIEDHQVEASPHADSTEGMLYADDLEIFFEDNPNPIWIYELDTFRFLKVNRAATALYGYTQEEFLTKTLYDLIPEADAVKLNDYLKRYKQGLHKQQFVGFNEAGVWRHQGKAGDIVIAEVRGHDYTFQATKCRLSIITNITEIVHYREEHKRREQFLSSLIDSQTNFLIRINAEGFFTFANRQFFDVFGFPPDQIIGCHFSTSTIPEELPKCEKAFMECTTHPGKVVQLIHRKPDISGNLHWTEWEFIAVTDENNVVIEIQGVGQDISKRVATETAGRAAAERLNTFIESITDSFFIIDREWRFVKVNSAFEKVCGKNRLEIIGNVIWELFPGIISTQFEEAYHQAVASQQSVEFTEYFKPLNMWFSTIVYPSIEGLTVFVRDITVEKLAQEETVSVKKSLESIINNTDDLIWSVNNKMYYTYLNEAYKAVLITLTGNEPKEGEHSYLDTGIPDPLVNQWNDFYKRALNGERYTLINETINPVTQSKQSYKVNFNPIVSQNGQINGVGCFAHDITADLEKEKALLDQNERLRYIANMSSHELRRPIASMLGLISLIDRSHFGNPDNKQIIEHLEAVGQEVDQVIRLIVDKTFDKNPL